MLSQVPKLRGCKERLIRESSFSGNQLSQCLRIQQRHLKPLELALINRSATLHDFPPAKALVCSSISLASAFVKSRQHSISLGLCVSARSASSTALFV
jgi:hypothetical protein